MKHQTFKTRRWLANAIEHSRRADCRAPWASPLTKAAFRAAAAKRLSES